MRINVEAAVSAMLEALAAQVSRAELDELLASGIEAEAAARISAQRLPAWRAKLDSMLPEIMSELSAADAFGTIVADDDIIAEVRRACG